MKSLTNLGVSTFVALAMFVAFVPSATFAADFGYDDLGGSLGGWDSYDFGGGYDSYDYGYGGYDYGYGSYDTSYDSYGYGYDYPYDYGNSYYEESSYIPYEYGNDPYYEESSYIPYEYGNSYYEESSYFPYSYGSSPTGGLFNWSSVPTGYSSGCYSCGGGYSYSTPKTGGGYYVAPKPVTPVTVSNPKYPSTPIVSGGGSQSQNQNQSQVSNNTNTNTNVNINNNTAIAVAQVPASYQQPAPTPYYPAPYCTITHAQSYGYGNYGYSRPVSLSWTSSNAQSAYLSGYGSVAVSGSQTVYMTGTSQTFTLTVYGSGGTATCQTTVYGGSTYVPPVQPTTPYVALTQIPYTGFDFGPFGNAMYWAGLAILALGGAYLAVYFVPQLAFARASYRKTFAPVVAPKAPILAEKEAADAKVAPIVASLKKSGTSDTMAIVHKQGSMPKIVIDRS